MLLKVRKPARKTKIIQIFARKKKKQMKSLYTLKYLYVDVVVDKDLLVCVCTYVYKNHAEEKKKKTNGENNTK